ncbi:universal stress protein [Natrialbaceae archaeon GCM10025810]|uniref:universal stress protein n=1 Tax=Halovalidus salilacus TaxID=3075124 RepID=UPI00361A649F
MRSVEREWTPEREREPTGPSRVLVPFDGSEYARAALEYALELFPSAEFTALTIVDDSSVPYLPNPFDGAGTGSGSRVDRAERTSPEREGVLEVAADHDAEVATTSRIGSPSRGVLDYLDESDVDHVVIGSRGRSGVSRIVHGSVAEVVVRHSPVPMTVVP